MCSIKRDLTATQFSPFIDRCIKPNRHQAPDEFNPDLVLTQLRSLAVVETAHIRNLGFPVWFTFDTFIQRYVSRCLACTCLKGIKKSWVLSLFVCLFVCLFFC